MKHQNTGTNSMKNLLILTPGYPYTNNNDFVFIRSFVENLVKKYNNHLTVVAPVSISRALLRKEKLPPVRTLEGSVMILRPRYLSVSNVSIFGFNLSNVLMNFSIYRISKREDYDIIYSHFWTQAMASYLLSKNRSVYVLVGESEISIHKMYPSQILRRFLNVTSGIMAASTKNLEDSLKLPIKVSIKNTVITNAVNPDIFYPRMVERNELGLNLDEFIIGFIGTDEPRKGLMNLLLSIQSLNISKIRLLVIGTILDPSYQSHEKIKLLGSIDQDLIAQYLSVVDIYCHPSIAEGSSNAILEALACGKPVIASREKFNDDILSDDYSYRIDVTSIDEISKSIEYCYYNRDELGIKGQNALKFSKINTIDRRVEKILDFIEL
jgi:teichuronic acid biosynthesis glycosyltransferase TuaC